MRPSGAIPTVGLRARPLPPPLPENVSLARAAHSTPALEVQLQPVHCMRGWRPCQSAVGTGVKRVGCYLSCANVACRSPAKYSTDWMELYGTATTLSTFHTGSWRFIVSTQQRAHTQIFHPAMFAAPAMLSTLAAPRQRPPRRPLGRGGPGGP